MAIVFPGEAGAPLKPDLETIESFDNSQIGGIEKFGVVSGSEGELSGGFIVGRTGTSQSGTTGNEVIIGVTSTASARTITLASASTNNGRMVIIKDESGGAGTNNITVDTEGSEVIDGAATKVINANYGVLRVYNDGTNWFSF